MNCKPRIYRALLNQGGLFAPVATVFENSIGDVVWNRTGVGNYQAILRGAFPQNKTFLSMTSPNSFSENISLAMQFAEVDSVDSINVTAIQLNLEAESLREAVICADGFSSNIKILVYP